MENILAAAIADLKWLLKQPANYDRCEMCAYNDECERSQEECERDAKWRGVCVSQNKLSIPGLDAAPVIRCKDCKHWLKDYPGCTDFVGRCDWANYLIGETGFCSYGERRDVRGTE